MEPSIRRKRLRIDGMTCVNCQNKIEKKLQNTAGVKAASVSYDAGTADIVYDADLISLHDICAVIEGLDYHVLADSQRQQPDIRRAVGLLVIIVSLYSLLSQFGVLNLLVPSRIADTKMGYGMLFVIGLITSVHCIAMCGGINLSQCIPQGEPAQGDGKRAAFRPALLYNLGRVISYTVIGFILGAAGLLLGGGADVGLPVFAQGILKLIAGVFMVVMGINMLGIFPWLRHFQPRMPGFLAYKIGEGKAKSGSPLIVGLLNGLMPCGPLQSMQVVALASGNPFAGALSMFLFSLGTVPLMLGLGSAVAALGRRFTKTVMTVGAVLVVVLGLAMLSQGGSLSGLLSPQWLLAVVIALCAVGIAASLPFKKPAYRSISTAATIVLAVLLLSAWSGRITGGGSGAANAGNVYIEDGKQVVTSTLAPGQYPNITVQAGILVKWIINAPEGSVNGCNYRINIQKFGIGSYDFKTGENVLEFIPTSAGTFQYSCWMGMIRGTITVTGAGEPAADAGTIPAGYKIPTDSVALAEQALYQNAYPVQEVTVELTDRGFSPAVIVVQSGLDVLWTIDNSYSGDTGLLVPDYAAALALSKGGNQFSFSPDSDFAFSTDDNAFFGYVKVVDNLKKADIEAIKNEVAGFETLIYPPETFPSGNGRYDASQAAAAEVENGVQYVTSTVGADGYEPIRVREGIPVKWTIQVPGGALNYCNESIYIPEYSLTAQLKVGDNLIEFTPDQSGCYAFSCWMGMLRGSITVERADGSVDYAQDDGSESLPSCCSR